MSRVVATLAIVWLVLTAVFGLAFVIFQGYLDERRTRSKRISRGGR